MIELTGNAEIEYEKAKGIDQVLANADREWKSMALAAVLSVAKRQDTFTVNDVRWLIERSPLKTHDKRAMGGVIKLAQKIGWIAPSGETRRSKVGHGIPMTVWRSLLYR